MIETMEAPAKLEQPRPTLDDLASQIEHEHKASERKVGEALAHARKAGELLIAVKTLLPHGQFGRWIGDHCSFSQDTANLYMRIARRWPEISERVQNMSLREVAKLVTGSSSPKPGSAEEVLRRVRLRAGVLKGLSRAQARTVVEELAEVYDQCCEGAPTLPADPPPIVTTSWRTLRRVAVRLIRDLEGGAIGHGAVRRRLRLNGLLGREGAGKVEVVRRRPPPRRRAVSLLTYCGTGAEAEHRAARAAHRGWADVGRTWRLREQDEESPARALIPHRATHHFLPAIVPSVTEASSNPTPIWWLDEGAEGEARHPFLLLSFYHWQRERYVPPSDAFVFGDSGGFSALSLGAAVDAEDALRWQSNRTRIGCILDIPPFVESKRTRVTPGWHAALGQTVEHVQRTLPLYRSVRESAPGFRWWGVLHGWTREQMEEWWGAISETHPFAGEGEGWAFKAQPPGNPEALARSIGFLRDKGVRRVHALMATGVKPVAVLAALSTLSAGFELLTYDSSSATHFAKNRKVWAPKEDGLGLRAIAENSRAPSGETPVRDFMDTCPCPSCEFYRSDREGWDEVPPPQDSYWWRRMLYHNVLTMRAVFNNIFDACRDDPERVLSWALSDKASRARSDWGSAAGRRRAATTLRAFAG
jgi:hypothetical protein